jgi:hypothetical protein
MFLYVGIIQIRNDVFGFGWVATEHFLYTVPGIFKGLGNVPGYVACSDKRDL